MRCNNSLLMAAFAIVASSIFAGCLTPKTVIVLNPSGMPIAGAEVAAVSASMNGAWITTDAKGHAKVHDNPQGIQWIRVRKTGYYSVTVDVPSTWPLSVTLNPIAKP